MLRIDDLRPDHLEAAERIMLANYKEARSHIPALPPLTQPPELASFAANGLGVVLYDDETMLGYLGCHKPWAQSFGTMPGTFSPLHASGTLAERRADVYARLYQAAAKKWVEQGILSHAICLYAHDAEALRSFFHNCFGLRCIDAIAPTQPLHMEDSVDAPFVFRELPESEFERILPLYNHLQEHMRQSPTFMPLPALSIEDFEAETRKYRPRYLVAERKSTGEIAAYLRASESGGETFVAAQPNVININGAYCLPEDRGSGLSKQLLDYLSDLLHRDGWPYLGVDFESINPNASKFWLKHFRPYTYSLTRRIDERISTMMC